MFTVLAQVQMSPTRPKVLSGSRDGVRGPRIKGWGLRDSEPKILVPGDLSSRIGVRETVDLGLGSTNPVSRVGVRWTPGGFGSGWTCGRAEPQIWMRNDTDTK